MSIAQYLFRGVRDLIQANSVPHSDLRMRLLTTVALTIGMTIVATIALFLVERHHPTSDIHSLWDAFYFTASQMVTLSTPMRNPVTWIGQIMVLIIDVYAITIVSTLAGMFGAFFYHRSDERRRAAEAKGLGLNQAGRSKP